MTSSRSDVNFFIKANNMPQRNRIALGRAFSVASGAVAIVAMAAFWSLATLAVFAPAPVSAADVVITSEQKGAETITLGFVDFICASGIATTRSAARRLIEQGAVKLDDRPVTTWDEAVDPGTSHVLRAGRKIKRYRPVPG